MNKKLLFLMPLIGAMSLAGCRSKKEEEPAPCTHVDANNDHKCDVCGETISSHADANGDFKCDVCGADLSIASVAVDVSGALKVFGTGEPFSSRGVKVIATSESGSTRELSFTTNKPDMSTAGKKTVTVSYKVGSETKTFDYEIEVKGWSSADLEKMDAISEESLSFMGICGLPYLPDHNMRIELEEEDEKVVGYTITADELSAEAYLRFVAALESYSYRDSQGTTYKFISSDADASGMGLEDTTVLRLTPTEKYYGKDVRTFVRDEYYLLGFDSTGKFVMTSFMVNAMLDGYFLGAEVAEFGESLWGFSKGADEILPDLCKIPLYYFSEYSSEKFVVPEVGSNASFYPISYLSSYPFSAMNDEWDLAFEVITENNSPEIQAAFVADLLAAGYVLQAPEKEDQTYDVYLLENAKVGKIEYTVYPFEEKSSSGETINAIVFDVFYKAPEEYTSHLRDVIEEIAGVSGITPKEEDPYGSTYTDYGVVAYALGTAKLSSYESEDHALEIITDITRRLLDDGDGTVLVKDEIEFNEAEEEGDDEYYSVVLSSGEIEVNVGVAAEAGEDGSHEVEIDIFDDKDSFSQVESYAASLCKDLLPGSHVGLRGVDFVASEDGKSFVISEVVDGASLEEAAESFTTLFDGKGFDKVSSEGEGEGESAKHTAVYDNSTLHLEIVVTATAGSEAGKYNVSVSVGAFNPELIMKQYIQAATGAPATPGSYVVNEDLSCVATGSKEVEIDPDDESKTFQAVAIAESAVIGGHLPEGFVSAGARYVGQNIRFAFVNSGLGMQAILVISQTETGIATQLTIEFIPQYSSEELLMKNVLSLVKYDYEPLIGYEYIYHTETKQFISAVYQTEYTDVGGEEYDNCYAVVSPIYSAILGSDLAMFGGAYQLEGVTGLTFVFGDGDGTWIEVRVYEDTTLNKLVYQFVSYFIAGE